jgi:hypothetical protein
LLYRNSTYPQVVHNDKPPASCSQHTPNAQRSYGRVSITPPQGEPHGAWTGLPRSAYGPRQRASYKAYAAWHPEPRGQGAYREPLQGTAHSDQQRRGLIIKTTNTHKQPAIKNTGLAQEIMALLARRPHSFKELALATDSKRGKLSSAIDTLSITYPIYEYKHDGEVHLALLDTEEGHSSRREHTHKPLTQKLPRLSLCNKQGKCPKPAERPRLCPKNCICTTALQTHEEARCCVK